MSALPAGFVLVNPSVVRNKRVSLAYRAMARQGKKGTAVLVVGVAKALLAELGWPRGGYVRLAYAAADGKLLLLASTRGGEGARKINDRHGNGSIAFRAPWIGASVMAQKAAEIPAEVTESGLLVTLPDYAAPTRVGTDRARASAQAAADRARGGRNPP